MEKDTIVICMGSSCFARGNDRNLKIIENYLFRKGLENQVVLKGTLCEGECTKGPNIIINGNMFQKVLPENLEILLDRELSAMKSDKNV